MARPRVTRAVFVLIAVAAVVYVIQRDRGGPDVTARPAPTTSRRTVDPSGEAEILRAFEQETSDLWVEAGGVVDRLLPDDTEGSRHQRFILRLPSGHTVLVSHNIDLAPRLSNLRVGDPVAFRGEYEWNARGGVIHWTHHDPQGRLPGGWLDHEGRRYE